MALQSLDPIFANPSYLIDPASPADTSSLVEDIVQASSVKRKRDAVSSANVLEQNIGASGSGETPGAGGFTAGVQLTGDPEYTVEKNKEGGDAKKHKSEENTEEDDWIIGNDDVQKSKAERLLKSDKASKDDEMKKEKYHTKSSNKETLAQKLDMKLKDAVTAASTAVAPKKKHNKTVDQGEKAIPEDEDNDWIVGSSDVITAYLKKKKQLESKLKKKAISEAMVGSGSGAGEYQFHVKPYSAEQAHGEKEEISQSSDFRQERQTESTENAKGHQVNDQEKTEQQQRYLSLLKQQQEASSIHHNHQRQPETLKELLGAPLQTSPDNDTTAKTSKNESATAESMNQIVSDKVVENPHLRSDYLFQLTHQSPVGLVGSNGEVESVGGEGAGTVPGSTRGKIQGEDDTEVKYWLFTLPLFIIGFFF